MSPVGFHLFENILYLGFVSAFISAGFSELVMQTNLRQWVSCKLLTYSTVFICVCVCAMQFVIVPQDDFLSLTGENKIKSYCKKKRKRNPHS